MNNQVVMRKYQDHIDNFLEEQRIPANHPLAEVMRKDVLALNDRYDKAFILVVAAYDAYRTFYRNMTLNEYNSAMEAALGKIVIWAQWQFFERKLPFYTLKQYKAAINDLLPELADHH